MASPKGLVVLRVTVGILCVFLLIEATGVLYVRSAKH